MRCPFCFAEKEADAPVCPTCNRDTEIPPSLRKEHDDLVRMRDQLLAELEKEARLPWRRLRLAKTSDTVWAVAEMVARIPAAHDQTATVKVPRFRARRLMECPFCAETIKDEATVCKHCCVICVSCDRLSLKSRISSLSWMGCSAGSIASTQDWRGGCTVRVLSQYAALYVVPVVLLLLIAHYLVTVQFNVSPLYLRLASFAIPAPVRDGDLCGEQDRLARCLRFLVRSSRS